MLNLFTCQKRWVQGKEDSMHWVELYLISKKKKMIFEMDTQNIDTCSLPNWWFVYALIDCLVCLVYLDNHTHRRKMRRRRRNIKHHHVHENFPLFTFLSNFFFFLLHFSAIFSFSITVLFLDIVYVYFKDLFLMIFFTVNILWKSNFSYVLFST